MPDSNLGIAYGQIILDVSSLGKASVAMSQVGKSMVVMGAALAAGLAAAVTEAAKFETQISIVKANTGETGKVIDDLRAKALQLGKDGPYGPIQIAQSFAILAAAGVKAEEIIGGVGQATRDLAQSGDISLAQSATVMAQTLSAFNLSADKATYVADTLAVSAAKSNLELSDMVTSMKYVAGVAQAVGIPLDQVTAAISALANAGIRGSTGGTVLRRILQQLDPVSKAAQKQLKELGIITADGANQFFTAEGKAKSLSEIFQILKDSTANLTDQQKLLAYATIFGARAASGALEITKNGAAGLDAILSGIHSDTAANIAKVRLDNLEGAIKRFKAAIQTFLVEAGEPLLNILKKLVDGATNLVKWFIALPSWIKETAIVGTGLVGVLTLISGGFLLTVGTIIRSVKAFGELMALLKGFSEAKIVSNLVTEFGWLVEYIGKAVVGAFETFYLSLLYVVDGLAAATSAVWAFTLSLLTNPIFLVIAAVAALAIGLYELYKHSKAFHDFVDRMWQDVQHYFKAIVDFVKKHWDLLVVILTGGLAAGLVAVIKWGPAVAHAMETAFFAVVHFFERLPGETQRGLETAAKWVIKFVTDIPHRFARMAGEILAWSVFWPIEVYKKIYQFIVDILPKWIEWTLKMVDKLTEMGGNILAATLDWVAKAGAAVFNFTIKMLDIITTWTGNMIAKIIDLAAKWGAEFINFLGRLPGDVVGWLGKVLDVVDRWVTEMVSWVNKLATKFLAQINKWGSELPGQILRIFTSVSNTFTKIGEDIILGIGDGMISAAKHVLGWVKSFFGGVGDVVKKVFGIFSPSRVFHAIGDNVMVGFQLGMNAQAKNAITQAAVIAQAISASFAANLDLNPQAQNATAMGLNPQAQNASDAANAKLAAAQKFLATVGNRSSWASDLISQLENGANQVIPGVNGGPDQIISGETANNLAAILSGSTTTGGIGGLQGFLQALNKTNDTSGLSGGSSSGGGGGGGGGSSSGVNESEIVAILKPWYNDWKNLNGVGTGPGPSSTGGGLTATPTGGRGGTTIIEKIEINNPIGQTSSDSMFNTMQKLAYLGVIGGNISG